MRIFILEFIGSIFRDLDMEILEFERDKILGIILKRFLVRVIRVVMYIDSCCVDIFVLLFVKVVLVFVLGCDFRIVFFELVYCYG